MGGELCKKVKFNHTTKLYMHLSEFIQENETQKILCYFEIQTDHLILVRRPNLAMIKKKKKKEKRDRAI